MSEILKLSLSEISEKIKNKEISPVELATLALDDIEKKEGDFNAYTAIMRAEALQQAKIAEKEILKGEWQGDLHGVPVAVKDLFDIKGYPTTASSRQRKEWRREEDSHVVRKLKKAGAVIVGKTHTHEFAYGTLTPTTNNPWDITRTPGGSSGGSAATVAAQSVYMALGTDTGGSIRIPASACGVVGLKPTYGRIGRSGVTSLSWSFDHSGPITKNARDAALSMRILAGFDSEDPASLNYPLTNKYINEKKDLSGLRVGVPENYFFENIDADVEKNVRDGISKLKNLGAVLIPCKTPHHELFLPTYFVIQLPEATAYHRDMLRGSPDLYNDDIRQFLELGEFVFASDYVRAQRTRQLIKIGFQELFNKIDVLVAPTLPAPAVKHKEEFITWPDGTVEPVTLAYIRYTMPADITGLPAISVPCGKSGEGLPIGMQLIGAPLQEDLLCNVAELFETQIDFKL